MCSYARRLIIHIHIETRVVSESYVSHSMGSSISNKVVSRAKLNHLSFCSADGLSLFLTVQHVSTHTLEIYWVSVDLFSTRCLWASISCLHYQHRIIIMKCFYFFPTKRVRCYDKVLLPKWLFIQIYLIRFRTLYLYTKQFQQFY